MHAGDHVRFIYDESELTYRFNDTHPFNQQRLRPTTDLLRRLGALPSDVVVPPRQANEDELALVHTAAYLQAVRELSVPQPDARQLGEADRFGLAHGGDTPYFVGMHEAAARIVGGSMVAADTVMRGAARHALHLAGGLHHAMPDRGSGFCVYNDAAVAIAHIRATYGARVLYVDTDVHHGDGVQWAFYSDPDVCTLSIHETGKFLFPGTGAVHERGADSGFGASVNVPVEPYTEDDSWLECFEDALATVAASFRPDVIVSQHGCDAHAFDPLADVQCSMRAFLRMPQLVHRLAHASCGGRWIALGGGGYDIWRVVPRAWSLLWLVMNDHPLVAELEGAPDLRVPADWLAHWQTRSPVELPATWLDPVADWAPMPRRAAIEQTNRQAKELALLYMSPGEPRK